MMVAQRNVAVMMLTTMLSHALTGIIYILLFINLREIRRNYNSFELGQLSPDMSSFERNVNPDQLASSAS